MQTCREQRLLGDLWTKQCVELNVSTIVCPYIAFSPYSPPQPPILLNLAVASKIYLLLDSSTAAGDVWELPLIAMSICE